MFYEWIGVPYTAFPDAKLGPAEILTQWLSQEGKINTVPGHSESVQSLEPKSVDIPQKLVQHLGLTKKNAGQLQTNHVQLEFPANLFPSVPKRSEVSTKNPKDPSRFKIILYLEVLFRIFMHLCSVYQSTSGSIHFIVLSPSFHQDVPYMAPSPFLAAETQCRSPKHLAPREHNSLLS
jgi:hypothetical protein